MTSLADLYKVFITNGMQVCTDTRKPVKGAVFFALRGPNFNANSFAAQALEAGCAAAVIDDEKYADIQGTLLVPDTLHALQQLARLHRDSFVFPVLAITGSNAKTTSKELITAVLSQRFNTLSTEGNLNNHIGVPLTLLKLRKEHDIAVIEMGANHQGEITALCEIANPTHGLITNIGKAHLEGFGGIEGVKKGKTELYRYIEKTGGKVFVNGDDSVLSELASGLNRISYGATRLYDVIGKDYTSGETVSLKFTTRYGEKNWDKLPLVTTQMTGGYNFANCLAAAAVGIHFNVDAEMIASALKLYRPEMNRSQMVDTGRNRVLLDAYNANPDSMKAAIENFAKQPADKKMLLLGDMFELGDYSHLEHETVVNLLKSRNLEEVVLVGKEFAATSHNGYKSFHNTEEAKSYLRQLAPRGYTILVKGSRGMKMETLSEEL